MGAVENKAPDSFAVLVLPFEDGHGLLYVLRRSDRHCSANTAGALPFLVRRLRDDPPPAQTYAWNNALLKHRVDCQPPDPEATGDLAH